MPTLIEKLQAAPAPDDDLDRELHEVAARHLLSEAFGSPIGNDNGSCAGYPHYTRDLSACGRLAAGLGLEFAVFSWPPQARVWPTTDHDDPARTVDGATPELALCLAIAREIS